MSTGPDVRLEFDGPVAVIVIDRPDSRNAISRATMDELDLTLDEVQRSDAHVLVLRGAGDRVFVSGGDLKELAAIRTHDEAQAMSQKMRGVLDRIAGLPIPVIGALNGDAYGGGAETAIACNYRIAVREARIGFNQVTLGIMPAWGGIERLGGLVGPSRALYLLTSGSVLAADRAAEWGLIEEVVERDAFDARCRELAHSVAEAPRDVLVAIKAALSACQPVTHPHLAESATDAFATSWIADAHWEMVAQRDSERRAAKAARAGQPA
jgi:enoyl-CoA hydratase/carnithine racemase